MLIALLALLALLAGCGGGAPQAVVPVARHDFGDLPTSRDKKDLKTYEFVIKNEGTRDLKLGEPLVKTLQGC